jgi:hypothetical protein
MQQEKTGEDFLQTIKIASMIFNGHWIIQRQELFFVSGVDME